MYCVLRQSKALGTFGTSFISRVPSECTYCVSPRGTLGHFATACPKIEDERVACPEPWTLDNDMDGNLNTTCKYTTTHMSCVFCVRDGKTGQRKEHEVTLRPMMRTGRHGSGQATK